MEAEKQVKVSKPEDSIQPATTIDFTHYDSKQGWVFYHSVKGMSSEKEMDQVSDKVGIMGLPEVFYGFNHLFVANKELNVLLDFNPLDSLSYSGFAKRERFLASEEKKQEVDQLSENLEKLMLDNSGLSFDEKDLNTIDLVPKQVQVQQAGFWKKKDTSKIKDYKEVE